MTGTTTQAGSRFGLSVALVTPFTADAAIDHERLVSHAEWCLGHGCDSITLFGTTGEGASIGLAGRQQMLGALAGHGIAARDVVAGVAAASLHETVEQARLALDFGCKGLLLAPPFYFKGVSDEGLFRWFAKVLETLGPKARDVILYHIPSVTAVGISIGLIDRLRAAFPGVVTGVKDSSGDAANTQALLDRHGDLAILVGDERQLAAAVRNGAQGTICGMANFAPALIRPVAIEGRDDPRVKEIVDMILELPVTPAVKALVAHKLGDPDWLHARPPLEALPEAEARRLGAAFDRIMEARAA
ncbi:dihydrodipicolinate synthase family protein [Alsobacter sp. SYSU M60028]|uniref:Dihydrodipicolinate synthase family protein n=1 Tax=Alsobacter ponti TaxID=2962936 RepID=A0ABT1L8L8_9HYPH|nr:dihydrodipicolinate synthase family protein [Alsobacter ponti]MCP8937845.1 dihydrodipicolinate synthase family protein [Alsobacter ponti]